ncbi:MAG: DUF411 domain-containing protein [Proteobacteria bacterium]|nr:DUF411 domain-containing protein [Pseudomonadota bacterium]
MLTFPIAPLNTTRRRVLSTAFALSALGLAPALLAKQKPRTQTVEVWKDPGCGCCKDWIIHLEKHGFHVVAHDSGNVAARARLGLPERYGSCHTAVVDGYLIEGHVGAAEIRRLLRERPKALGLAVPGMPIGSPGMDGPAYGTRRDRYATLLVLRDGSNRVFQQHG